MQLDLLPGGIVARIRAEAALDVFHRFHHALVVKIDALARRLLHRGPVAGLEMALRRLAGFAENAVMLVETLQHHLRDAQRKVFLLGRRGQGLEGLLHALAPRSRERRLRIFRPDRFR